MEKGEKEKYNLCEWVGTRVVLGMLSFVSMTIFWMVIANATITQRPKPLDANGFVGRNLLRGSVPATDTAPRPRTFSHGTLDVVQDTLQKVRHERHDEYGRRRQKLGVERNNDCETVVNGDGMVAAPQGQLLTTKSAISQAVSNGDYVYYMVCVSRHNHHHRVNFNLRVHQGEADLYVSASEVHPRVDRGSTWISASSGGEYLSLPTYAEDFMGEKPRAIFVGVHGRPDGVYSLAVNISDISDKEMSAHKPLDSWHR